MRKNKAIHSNKKRYESLSGLAALQLRAKSLPPLSGPEKAKFDNALAIDQLYYSSKVEGTTLTDAMIERAIHGKLSTP